MSLSVGKRTALTAILRDGVMSNIRRKLNTAWVPLRIERIRAVRWGCSVRNQPVCLAMTKEGEHRGCCVFGCLELSIDGSKQYNSHPYNNSPHIKTPQSAQPNQAQQNSYPFPSSAAPPPYTPAPSSHPHHPSIPTPSQRILPHPHPSL